MIACTQLGKKDFHLIPQLLKACNPPIPFHYIKKCTEDYVIPTPGAYHFVINS